MLSVLVLLRRSIPVHTGKPKNGWNRSRNMRVYPRTHGETTWRLRSHRYKQGLSPYTRGNQFPLATAPACLGSIPVHTGKPFAARVAAIHPRVYPRTHGETRANANAPTSCQGLSPYTRGNLMFFAILLTLYRSIPVHTGKPKIICKTISG